MAHAVADGQIEIVNICSPTSYWIRCSNCFNPAKIHFYLDSYLKNHFDELKDSFKPQLGDTVCVLGIDDLLHRGEIKDVVSRSSGNVVYSVLLKDYEKELNVLSDSIYPCELKWRHLEPQLHLIGLFGLTPCRVTYRLPLDVIEKSREIEQFENKADIVTQELNSCSAVIFNNHCEIDGIPYGCIHLQRSNEVVSLRDILVSNKIAFESDFFELDLIAAKYILKIKESKLLEDSKQVKALEGNPVKTLSYSKFESVDTIPSRSIQEISESFASTWLEPFKNYMKRLADLSSKTPQEPCLAPSDKIVLDVVSVTIDDPVVLLQDASVTPPVKLSMPRKIAPIEIRGNAELKRDLEDYDSGEKFSGSASVLSSDGMDADGETPSRGDSVNVSEELITFQLGGKDILESSSEDEMMYPRSISSASNRSSRGNSSAFERQTESLDDYSMTSTFEGERARAHSSFQEGITESSSQFQWKRGGGSSSRMERHRISPALSEAISSSSNCAALLKTCSRRGRKSVTVGRDQEGAAILSRPESSSNCDAFLQSCSRRGRRRVAVGRGLSGFFGLKNATDAVESKPNLFTSSRGTRRTTRCVMSRGGMDRGILKAKEASDREDSLEAVPEDHPSALSSNYGSSESLASRNRKVWSPTRLSRSGRGGRSRGTLKFVEGSRSPVDANQKDSPNVISPLISESSINDGSHSVVVEDKNEDGPQNDTLVANVSTDSFTESFRPFLSAMKSSCCLVHGNVDFQQEFSANRLQLNFGIKEALAKARIHHLLRAQAFSIPVILQRRNVIVVSPPKNKRTSTYVIPLLSLLMNAQHYAKLPQSFYPRCVIIASNSHRVKYIGQMCRDFSCGKLSVVTTHGGGLELERKNLLVAGCDILVSTPRCWLRLLNYSLLTNTSRLCHLVLDNRDEMLRLFSSEVASIFTLLRKETASRKTKMNNDIQTIIVNESWSPPLEQIAFKHLTDPVLVFASHIEAAIYGKMIPNVRLIKSEKKIENIHQIVREFGQSKIVIVCSTIQEGSDVYSAVGQLHSNIIWVHENFEMQSIKDKRREWEESKSNVLLICTDSVLPEMAVNDARILIHASLPLSKSFFNDRFIVIQKSLPDRIKTPNAPRPDCQVTILLSEEDQLQFPNIVDFMLRIPLDVPDAIKDVAQKIRRKNLLENHETLCQSLLLRGNCVNEMKCRKRHVLVAQKDDVGNLPSNGLIKFEVSYVHSPVGFSVRILSHTKGTQLSIDSWTPWPSNKGIISSKMKDYFAGKRCFKHLHGRPKIGDVVGIEVDIDVEYWRAKVVEIVQTDDKCNPTTVRVLFMDNGQFKICHVQELLALPSDVASLPRDTVDVCLLNLLPVDMDTEWSYVSTKAVRERVQSPESSSGRYVLAKVACSIGDTLLVESFHVEDRMDKVTSTVFNLRSFLLQEKMAVDNPEHLEKIKLLFQEAGMKFPEKEVSRQNRETTQNSKVQWSHLSSDSEDLSDVIVTNIRSPSLFFCSQIKFNDLLLSLEKDMSAELCKKKSVLRDPFEGCFCAVLPSAESRWNRAQIIACSDDELEVFYVDYGEPGFVRKEQAYVIPEKFLNKLPFQAIECELAGIKPAGIDWSEKSIDFFFSEVWELNDGRSSFLQLKVSVCELELKAQMTGGRHYKVILMDRSNSSINEAFAVKKLAVWDSSGIEHLKKWKMKAKVEDTKKTTEVNFEESDVHVDSDLVDMMLPWISMDEGRKIPYPDSYEDSPNSPSTKTPEGPHGSLAPPTGTRTTQSLKNAPVEKKESPSDTQNTSDSCSPGTMKQLVHLGVFLPKVLWRQSADYVWMKFMLTDMKDFDLTWSNYHVDFCTNLEGQDYAMIVDLFGSVYGSSLTTNKTGFYLEVKVMKVARGRTWPRLSRQPTKCPFIKADVSMDSVDEEESLVKLLIEKGENESSAKPQRQLVNELEDCVAEGIYSSNESLSSAESYQSCDVPFL